MLIEHRTSLGIISCASHNFRKTHSSLEEIMNHQQCGQNLCFNQGLAVAGWPNRGRGLSGRQMAALGRSQDKRRDTVMVRQGRRSPRPYRVALSLISPQPCEA